MKKNFSIGCILILAIGCDSPQPTTSKAAGKKKSSETAAAIPKKIESKTAPAKLSDEALEIEAARRKKSADMKEALDKEDAEHESKKDAANLLVAKTKVPWDEMRVGSKGIFVYPPGTIQVAGMPMQGRVLTIINGGAMVFEALLFGRKSIWKFPPMAWWTACFSR